jgi:hypothetical protein
MSDSRRTGALLGALSLALLSHISTSGAAESEFRYQNGELKCVSAKEVATQEMAYRDCLAIGPVRIGDTFGDVAMKFGKARQSVARGAITERVYPIDVGVAPGQAVPYWVIGFEGQTVVSIQISGHIPVAQYGFSSIHVGDPESKIRERLGPAGFSQPAPNIGGVMWGYPPYPVTFEIKDGRVYSMRISEAIGK